MITLTWTTNNSSSTSTFSVSNIPSTSSGAVIYATLGVADGHAQVDTNMSSYINWDGGGGVNSRQISGITEFPYTFYLGRMGLSVTITNIRSVWSIINNINVNSSPTDNPVIHTDDGYQIRINNTITPLQNIVETNTTNRITYNLYTSTYGYKRKNNWIQLPKWDSNYHFENSKYDLQSLYRLNNNSVRNGYSCKTGYYPNQNGMNKKVNQWGKIIIPGYRESNLNDVQKWFKIWKNENYLYIRRCSDENGTMEETTVYNCKSNSIILDLVACGGQGGQYYYPNITGYDPEISGGGGGGGSFVRLVLNLGQAISENLCFFINLDRRFYSNNSYPNNHVVFENGYFVSKHWCSISFHNNNINSGYICLQCGGDSIANGSYFGYGGGGGKINFSGNNNIDDMPRTAEDIANAISTYHNNYGAYIKILNAYWGKNGGRGSMIAGNNNISSTNGGSFIANDIYNSCGDPSSYSVYKTNFHGVGGNTSKTFGYGGGGASAIGIGTSDGSSTDQSGNTGWGGGDCGRKTSNSGQRSCAILHW